MTLEHSRGVPHEGILIGKFVGMWAMHDGKLKDGVVLGWAEAGDQVDNGA